MAELPKKILVVTALAAGAAMGGLLFGYDTSTVNAAIPGARTTMGLSNAVVGFIAAVSLIGCAVGAWFAAHGADARLVTFGGRRWSVGDDAGARY